MNKGTQLANMLMEKQGYIIIAVLSWAPPISGRLEESVSSESFGDVPGPFYVIGTATREEFLQQALTAGCQSRDTADYTHFYKLVAE